MLEFVPTVDPPEVELAVLEYHWYEGLVPVAVTDNEVKAVPFKQVACVDTDGATVIARGKLTAVVVEDVALPAAQPPAFV